MKFFYSFTLFFVIFLSPLRAQETVREATEMVRDTCQTAKDEGSFSSLIGTGKIDGNVRLRLVVKLNADAFVELTEEEWTSIRQVVKTDQLADNLDYRACVRVLTPIVIDKLP
ncbi:hypothetical protein [Maritalea sp.]|uniref:hypothetical protein n=1 Tax=Maritalea sp. TaxID=2003361 RepID=UPI003EF8AFDE